MESNTEIQQLGILILTAITAIAASFSAIAAWLSAKAIKSTTEANLYLQFLEEYSDYKMVNSLRILKNWKDESPNDFNEKWIENLANGDEKAQEIDKARRHVKFYFLKALKLYTSKFVSKKFIEQVIAVDGITIMFEIIQKLEYALNPEYDRSTFEKLRELNGFKRKGKKIVAVPLSKN